MNKSKWERARLVGALSAILAVVGVAACAGRLTARPELYKTEKIQTGAKGRGIELVLVKPVAPKPSPVLVLFASGDGGLMGASKTVLQHLADQGYYVAGLSSRQALGIMRPSGQLIQPAEGVEVLAALKSQAKAGLGLPADTPVVVTGMSRGANLVIFAAGNPTLKSDIVGAVAMALTRELDYLEIPDAAVGQPGIKVDEKGRGQAYHGIERLGSVPLAVIQSTKDKYVPSAESRQLLGPDTPTRRLYEVPSSGHSFGGGEATMLKDLDDALAWIGSRK